jgi:FkbM family methyltransferase
MLNTAARWVRPVVQRSPRLVTAYRHCRDSAHVADEPKRTGLGFDFGGHSSIVPGRFEPDEVALVKRLLGQSDVVISIGPNVGYYRCLALVHNKPVISVEPVPASLQVRYLNLRANGGAQRAEVHRVSLGSSTGLVDIYGGGTAASLLEGWAGIPVSYKKTVPLTTLDSVMQGRYADQRKLVLMDVEGPELIVLHGAMSLVQAKVAPNWIVEVNIDEHQPGGRKLNANLVATFEIFERQGYGAWLVGGQPKPVPYEAVRAIAATGKDTLAGRNHLFSASADLPASV